MNKTNRKPPPCGSRDGEVVKRSVDAALGSIVVILNIVEIIMIARLKRKKRIYEVLLLSLSSSDIMFGLANLFISVIYLSKNCNSDEIFNIIYSFYLFAVLTSICHLSWIALDRLWAVSKPFRHNAIVTRKKLYVLIACTWFISFSIAVTLNLVEELTESFGRKGDDPSSELLIFTATTTTTTNPSIQVGQMRGTRRPLISKNRPPPKKLRPLSKEKYQEQIQFAIAVLLIIADIIFITAYGAMVYILDSKVKYSRVQAKKEDRISLVCISIAAAFVVLTLPYSFAVFIDGRARFEINLLLIINGGLNSIIYFFRAKCEKYVEKKYRRDASDDSSNVTSLTTASANSTPQLMLKSRSTR